MSSHLEQIEALIAEIDGVLQQPIPRLPWMGEASRESRRVLERIRAYLEAQQIEIKAAISQKERGESDSITGAHSLTEEPESQQTTSDLLMQAVEEEIKTLRSTLIQPLLTDIQALQQERDSLLREIRQLEIQRQQQHSLAQQAAYQQQIITEFLQNIKNCLQETLTQQVVQTLANIEYQFLAQEEFAPPSLTGKPETKPPEEEQEYKPIWDPSEAYGKLRLTPLNRQERLEQLRMLQVRVDEMLKNLDSTLAVGFETLQRNIQIYEESLSRGIEKIHSLGQQSELLFTQLVSHLAQKLGQEAAGLLKASIPRAKLEPAAELVKPLEAAKEKKVQSPDIKQAPPTTGEKRPAATSKITTKKELSSSEKQPTAGKSAASKKSDLAKQKTPEAPKTQEAPPAETLELLMNLPVISEESTAVTETKQKENLDLLALLAEWPEPQVPSAATASAPTTNTLAVEVEKEDSVAEFYTNLFAAEESTGQSIESSPADSKPPASGFDIFEQTLFDGFAEPASRNIEEKQIKPTEIAPPSLEEFLFGEETNELPQITLENLFPETESEPPTENASQEAPNTQVSQSSNSGNADIFSLADFEAVLGDDLTSDSYTPASPEEILLPIVEMPEEQRDDLSIDSNTLQQLTKDLSALEGFENWNVPPQGQSASANVAIKEERAPQTEQPTTSSASEDWDSITLFDWRSEELSVAPANETRQTEENQPFDSSETWLDEFNLKTEELPSNPPAQTQSPPAAETTSNMTLDEAFASLIEAIPLARESLEAEAMESWNPNPTLPVAEAIASENTSTLDQLFASMDSESSASAAKAESEITEIVVDDFDVSLTSSELTSATGAADFDELLAELWAETPTTEISPESEIPEKKTSVAEQRNE
ncbi:MAG: hypothetical protein N3E45_00960 [Oscillatoriaceae bacterium SKW80]|nr:hypothetical protein [Oscillatoriaceae bacterium SKYG93]MCX8119399.1 hypothetical protein [Oscillatoriaceae bacterium SKW80]MDW8454866.1 hypothetical protein [Oscillatoriaceae cyanobacterium SKYGB_i_bin93]HIK28355.1 hypothetical protein [Oscillatoriaceae cyanobacterium M7585_C2015_266]